MRVTLKPEGRILQMAHYRIHAPTGPCHHFAQGTIYAGLREHRRGRDGGIVADGKLSSPAPAEAGVTGENEICVCERTIWLVVATMRAAACASFGGCTGHEIACFGGMDVRFVPRRRARMWLFDN